MEVKTLDANDKASAIPGTTGVYDDVAEIELLDSNNKPSAIPGTTTVFDQVTEIEVLDANNKQAAIPGTTTVHDQVAEIDILNANDKQAAIPGTTTVHDQVTEVDVLDANDKQAAIPGTTTVHDQVTEVNALDLNGKPSAIPGTTTVFSQVAEADSLEGSNGAEHVGLLRLRGETWATLTAEQRTSFEREGYLILPDALPRQEIDQMLDEAYGLMERIKSGGEGIKRHDISKAGAKRPSPVGRVIATFETGDTAPDPFERRVARLGSAVHRLSSFRNVTFSELNHAIVESLGYTDPRITQSQVITKLAGIGGEISPHQDGNVSFTNPPSCLTFWYALEDTTLENGCLCVAPGSHLTNPLVQRTVKMKDGLPKFIDLETPLWAREAKIPADGKFPTELEYVPLEMKKGSLLVFHGNLVHKSAQNKSLKDRLAYTFNIIEGGLECGDDNYLKPEEGDFGRFI